jgi:putative nucleotidyltransferase with HDIG domain
MMFRPDQQPRQGGLRQAVRRALLRRILLASCALSVLLGIVSYLVERDRVGEAVIAHALNRADLFNSESRQLLDVPGLVNREEIQRELATFAQTHRSSELGQFELVHLFDLNSTRVAAVANEQYPHIDRLRELMSSPFHSTWGLLAEECRVVRVAGRPHREVVAPLLNSAGEQVGVIEGILALSSDAILAARWRLIRVGLIVVGVVLVTSLLIYPIVMELVRRLTGFSDDLLQANLDSLQTLGSAVAKRDGDTQTHSYRVTLIAARLAEAMGMSDAEIRRLLKGALLHDIGKIAISDRVLLKPGTLTDEEFSLMQTHVSHGAEIVERSAWLEGAQEVVRYHHEKFDGSGYLEGLAADEIPVAARIFSIADVFDALTSQRPYKQALSFEETMALLGEGRGTHFDPQVLDAFAAMAGELHQDLAEKDTAALRRDLRAVVDRYFSGGLDVLEA